MKHSWSTRKRKRGAGFGLKSFRSPVAAVVVALALLVQLIVLPYHQSTLAAAPAPSDAIAIAAELKATFGEAAALCVQVDDKGAPAPARRCDDQCPLCRFSADAATLITPVAPALPARLDVSARTQGVAPQISAPPERPAQPNQARAPPLAV